MLKSVESLVHSQLTCECQTKFVDHLAMSQRVYHSISTILTCQEHVHPKVGKSGQTGQLPTFQTELARRLDVMEMRCNFGGEVYIP
jgi:hypothetical protein